MNKKLLYYAKMAGGTFLAALFCMGIGLVAYAFSWGAWCFSYLPIIGTETHKIPTIDVWIGGLLGSLFTFLIICSKFKLGKKEKNQ